MVPETSGVISGIVQHNLRQTFLHNTATPHHTNRAMQAIDVNYNATSSSETREACSETSERPLERKRKNELGEWG